MTCIPGFHLHLVRTGNQLNLQLSYTYPTSEPLTIYSETGSFTLQAEMCSDCLMILKRLEGTSPVWRLRTARIEEVVDLLPSSFRLCDPEDQKVLQAIGLLKKSTT